MGVINTGFTYDYYLVVDDVFIPAVGRKPNARKKHSAIVAEYQYWMDLSPATGMDYVPGSPTTIPRWRHRLIGDVNGYLTMVSPNQFSKTSQAVYSVLVRHAPLLNPKAVEASLLENPEIKELRGKLSTLKRSFEVEKDFTWISFQYNLKKDRAEQISEKIFKFVKILSGFARPLPYDICEGKVCRFKSDRKTKLVVINN